jgi:hypothetical protein
MGARLIQLDEGRPVAVIELGGKPLSIGRDLGCDVVVDHNRVSRRHVLVEWSNGRGVLQDLGSANGTVLNGVALEGAAELCPGDQFSLAGEVPFFVESTDRPPWVRALLWLAALLIATSAGWAYLAREDLYWRFGWRFDEQLAQARSLASEGLEAAERGDDDVAMRRLQQAFWLLDTNHYLDDVRRRETFTVGLQRLALVVGTDQDLHALMDGISTKKPPEVLRPGDHPACRLDSVPAPELRTCLKDYVRYYARALRQKDDEIPEWFVDQVGKTLVKEGGRIQRALDRGRPHFPMMKEALSERNMPPLLYYLAGAESSYVNQARSPKAAAGMWQFMPDTARRFGLVVDGKVDERTDPRKATAAAAEYLRDLALEFGGDSLLLAMAGYNRGENGVRAALRKLEDPFADRSYWTLCRKQLLPAETREYAARIFAQAVGGEGGVPDKAALERAGF